MRASVPLLVALGIAWSGSIAFADPPLETVDDIVCRGTSAVGFSYAWGGECWCASGCAPDFASCNPGVCTVNSGSSGCPNCTHTGAYGADCSGFVSRAWQVPRAIPVDACNTDRYVASNFTSDNAYWDVVSMGALQPADAVASSSHVILVIGYEDAFGDHEVVEAKGCIYGIIRQSRTFSSSYSGARRINLVDCDCDAGDVETADCGDCGTQERSCSDGCHWSPWSACEGPDPSGGDEPCTVPGATGVCAEGRSLCVAGWLTCEAQQAGAETCDGLDNDCDGVVDNGTAESLGEGLFCTNDCGAGETLCVDGAMVCVTPGTTWPDDDCSVEIPEDAGTGDGGITDDSGVADPIRLPGDPIVSTLRGGCACSATSNAADAPVAVLLASLVMVFWRRLRG